MKRTVLCLFLILCLLLPMTVSAAAQSPALLTADGAEGGDFLFELVMILVVPLVVALIICLILRGQMKTARKQSEATDYMVSSAPKLTVKTDRFTHRTQTRRRIEKKQSK